MQRADEVIFLGDSQLYRLILSRGRLDERETPTTGVAAVSAGGYAATVEMARYFEIETEFQQISYAGEYHSIYSSNVGNAFIITVVFDHSVKLGIVGTFANQAAQCLQHIANRATEMKTHERLPEAEKMCAQFGQVLMDEVAALLSEG